VRGDADYLVGTMVARRIVVEDDGLQLTLDGFQKGIPFDPKIGGHGRHEEA
jgi:hypothetical protein